MVTGIEITSKKHLAALRKKASQQNKELYISITITPYGKVMTGEIK